MMAFTTNQWAVVALLFVAGWLLGLMSRSSGGGRWRRDYEREHEAHLALRRDYDALIARRDQPAAIDPASVRPSVDSHF